MSFVVIGSRILSQRYPVLVRRRKGTTPAIAHCLKCTRPMICYGRVKESGVAQIGCRYCGVSVAVIRQRKPSIESRQKVVRLLRGGTTVREVKRLTGVCHRTIVNLRREHFRCETA